LYIFNRSCTNIIVSRSIVLTNLAVSLQCLAPSVSVSESPRCRIDCGTRAPARSSFLLLARVPVAHFCATPQLNNRSRAITHVRSNGQSRRLPRLDREALPSVPLHPTAGRPVRSSALPLFSRNTCPLSCAAYNARDLAVPGVGKEAAELWLADFSPLENRGIMAFRRMLNGPARVSRPRITTPSSSRFHRNDLCKKRLNATILHRPCTFCRLKRNTEGR